MKFLRCRNEYESRFPLDARINEAFVPGPESGTLRLDYEGRIPEKTMVRNAAVHPGMLLARHPNPGRGDLCSPAAGVVGEVGTGGLTIKVGAPAPKPPREDGQAASPESVPPVQIVEPVDFSLLEGEELVRALKEGGIDVGALRRPCEVMIINALNPEPGIVWANAMLGVHADVLAAGLALLRRLSPAQRFVLACPAGDDLQLAGMEVSIVPAVYPSSLDPLVIKAVTGKERPQGVSAIGVHDLWKLGRVARTGMPLAETVLSLAGVNYVVTLGLPAGELLARAGLALAPGDTLVFGGPLRGEARAGAQAGVNAHTYGLGIVRREDVPPPEGDAACVSCGDCVRICPARLEPDLISRYSEFGRDDKCAAVHIDACMDCGLCTYACQARRPVLQYIRLARGRLAAARQEQ
jgi:electron transport complex protein RnfC